MSNQDFLKVMGYEEQYLQSKELETRQCVYIGKETHEVVADIVKRLGSRKLSIGAYIDSILQLHLQEHKDEINELYQKPTGKIIK